MLRLFIYLMVLPSIFLLAFTLGVAVAEFKHPLYYKFRNIIYKTLSIERAEGRNASYYREKLSLYRNDSRQDYDIVFIGDSLTDGADWQSFFPSKQIANRGINGDTTEGVLERLDSITNTGANLAFTMIGVNEIRRRFAVDDIVARYRRIIDALLAADMAVIIQSTIYNQTENPVINDNIQQLNLGLQAIAQEHTNVDFIDVNTALAAERQLKATFTYDGVHLNGQGYDAWKNAISSLIN